MQVAEAQIRREAGPLRLADSATPRRALYGIVTTVRTALATAARLALIILVVVVAGMSLSFLLEWRKGVELIGDGVRFLYLTCLGASGVLFISAALWFGLIDVGRHYLLRLCLARQRLLPMRVGQFLSHAVHLVLMRRAGGTYLFLHRLVLDYFADLTDGDMASLVEQVESRPSEAP